MPERTANKSQDGRIRYFVNLLLVVTLLLAPIMTPQTAYAATIAAPTPPHTVVSFTFDDALSDQMAAAEILDKYGFKGTFYVNSGLIGSPEHLTRGDLNTLAANGHEIAGHTTNHVALPIVSPNEAMRQVCTDRATLTEWGFHVTSFAYPYSIINPAVAAIVKKCGYDSARTTTDLVAPHSVDCAACATAETIPPRDPFHVRTPDEILPNWTLSDLEKMVADADANGGGWIPLVLHEVCDGCNIQSTSPLVLDQFANWLKHEAPGGTEVKPVNEVIGGPILPLVAAPPPNPSTAVITNASLEVATPVPPTAAPSLDGTIGPGPNIPQCWQAGGYGANTATFTRTYNAHGGTWAEQLDVTGYVDGDAKLQPQMDLGSCAPSARAGESYEVGTWYESTVRTQYAMYYRTSHGAWMYWTSSPWFASSPRWAHATWTTPPAPADATAISFGLTLASNGTLVTDDYSLGPASPSAGLAPLGILILRGLLVILAVLAVRWFVRRRKLRRALQGRLEAEDGTRMGGRQ